MKRAIALLQSPATAGDDVAPVGIPGHPSGFVQFARSSSVDITGKRAG
jgi:hypothetical protein